MNDNFEISEPLVSVILPVYNGERFLADAIRSVLNQGYQPLEIIIIDDGSTDMTAQIAQGFTDRVRYYYQSNSGPAAARNLGIRQASGDFIAFIDADDLWPDDKLRNQMNCFEVFSDVDIVQGLIRRTKDHVISDDIDFLFIYTNLGSMIFRKSVFDKIGFFDEDLVYHEDTDFWLRAREAGFKILVQRKEALIYRLHGKNLTTGKDIQTTGFLQILCRSISRRRFTSGYVHAIQKLSFVEDFQDNKSKHDLSSSNNINTSPLVSVIFYLGTNSVDIGRSLDSILRQDYKPKELIVIASKTELFQKLTQNNFERIETIECTSYDLASLLNTAIDKCSGDFVTFLDSDGEWPAGKLSKQVGHLLEHPSKGYLAGRTRHIIEPTTKYASDLLESLNFRKSLGDLLSTLIISRSTFATVGKFAVGFPGMEETDWILRAIDKGFQKNILPDVFLYRYVQPDTNTQSPDQLRGALLSAVRASVQRKRDTAPDSINRHKEDSDE